MTWTIETWGTIPAKAIIGCVLLAGAVLVGCGGDPTLAITDPTSGAMLGSSDDEDPTTPDTVEYTVEVAASDLDGSAIELYGNSSAAGEPLAVSIVTAGRATFSAVSFAPGGYELLAIASDTRSPAVPITVAVGGTTCGSIEFVTPAVTGDRVTLGAGDDQDGDPCGASFSTEVVVSTDLGDGLSAQLFVNGTPRGTATVTGTLATFPGVVLDNRGATPNTIEVAITTPAGDCRNDLGVPVFVDCEGASCSLTFPDSSSAFLNASDDADPDTAGLQTNFTVESDDASSAGETFRLLVDGASVDASAVTGGTGAVATFTNRTLAEGPVTVQGVCSDGLGNLTMTGEASWTVDITPCGVDITDPTAGRAAMGPFTPTDDIDGSTPEIDITVAATAAGSDCTASRTGIASAIGGVAFTPLASADFGGPVTLDSSPSQTLVAEVQDAAGNVGQGTLDITVRTDSPQLAFASPAADSAINIDGTGGALADLVRPSATCEVAIVVNCTDVGQPVALVDDTTGAGIPGGTADCTAMAGLPAPFAGQATFAAASLPTLNTGAGIVVRAEQSVAGLSGRATLNLFPDCEAPILSVGRPATCPTILRPSMDDEDPGTLGLQYRVQATNNNSPKPPVDLEIRRSGGGATVYTATSSTPAAGIVTDFVNADFSAGGELEVELCATDAAGNTGCSAACAVTVEDIPVVNITAPSGVLDGTTPPDCDSGTAGYQVTVSATTDAPNGENAEITVAGGTPTSATVTGGAVTACVDIAEGLGQTIRVTAGDAPSTGSANTTVDVDLNAPPTGVSDLAGTVANRRRGRVRFNWTSVGDGPDINVLASYELRCADAAISSEGDWTAAETVGVFNSPGAIGSAESEIVNSFRIGDNKQCMVRGTDFAGRLSPLGNNTPVVLDWATDEQSLSGVAQLGYDIQGVGDVNGDGRDDVLVTAPEFFTGLGTGSNAYLYLGTASGLPTAPSVRFLGGHITFGVSAAPIGDFNADGRADFAISERGFGGGVGRVHIFYGRDSGSPWPATIDLRTVCNSDVCLNATGAAGTTTFGWSLGSGDFNNDGASDIYIGAPFISASAGRVYVILGSATSHPTGTSYSIPVGGSIVPDMTQPAGFYVGAPASTMLTGVSVGSVGDHIGSAEDDLIIGATGDAGMTISGKVLEVAGRSYPAAGVGLQAIASSAVTLIDSGADGAFGEGLASVDYNNDGHVDLLVYASTAQGDVWVYPQDTIGGGFDSADRIAIANDVSGRANDRFGSSMGSSWNHFLGNTCDIDDDGYGDVVIGADQRGTDAGALELYFSTAVAADRSRRAPDSMFQPPPLSPTVRRSVACIGDVNGDGFADLALGDPQANTDVGRFFFLY